MSREGTKGAAYFGLSDPQIRVVNGRPYSERFDDYYASDDPFGEKSSVLVDACELEERWQGAANFSVAELGFGLGASFLSCWQRWRNDPRRGAHLTYVSCECFPLSLEALSAMTASWTLFGELRERLLAHYRAGPEGLHWLELDSDLSLLLVLGDARRWLPELTGNVDAWVLDGFAPVKNPELWGDDVLDEVARLAGPGCRLATYTAVGRVRHGLKARGFEVKKRPGHAGKWHMTTAKMAGVRAPAPTRVRVEGAGIAGASVVRSLRRRGLAVDWADPRGLGSGASGNPLALLSPRATRTSTPLSRFSARAYEHASRTFRSLAVLECSGVMRLLVDDELVDRYDKAMRSGVWAENAFEWMSPEEIARRCGIESRFSGVFVADGGTLEPLRVLRACSGERLPVVESDPGRAEATVYCRGFDLPPEPFLALLPLRASRGQLTLVHTGLADPVPSLPTTARGYLAALRDGTTAIGASYERYRGEPLAVREQDHALNLEKVRQWAPAGVLQARVVGGRVSVRSLFADHAPAVGRLGERAWLLTGLGSRGFSTAPLLAEVLAQRMVGGVEPLERSVAPWLDPLRFTRGC